MAAGRQREFDKQIALDAAMELFWSNGYSGTSLSDLTNAMGINKPSLYAAFGNKEALCISALNQYVSKYGSPHMEELNAPNKSLRSRLTAYLKSIARMVSDPALPGTPRSGRDPGKRRKPHGGLLQERGSDQSSHR